MKKYLTLVYILLDLEIESINNDVKDHFVFNDWYDKFGDNSDRYAEELVSEYEPTKHLVEKLTEEIQKDFEKGYWKPNSDGSLYHYMMPTEYGGEILEIIEIQLADLTKIGTQIKINL